MSRLRSALFVDFDNVFSGLLDLDPKAGLAFAQDPRDWLDRLATTGIDGDNRSFLVRRCYMNPSGWALQAPTGQERIYFSKFRPYFTRAGFEVIDCPSLTNRHKNAADIRICLDVFESLSRDTRYDEYVIASGDSDFAPLLQRVRASDRRILVIATSQTAIAYESIADQFMDEQQVIDLMLGTTAVEEGPLSELSAETGLRTRMAVIAPEVEGGPAPTEILRQLVTETLEQSPVAVQLAALGIKARATLGHVVDSTNWFGAGSLGKAITRLAIPGVNIAGHFIWLDQHHEAPESASGQFASTHPEFLVRLCRVADVPRLDSATWPRVFEQLAAYASEEEFNLTEATRWVRDHLAVEGADVGRGAIGFTIQGATYGGAPLTMVPSPSAVQIATAFLKNAVRRATAVELTLNDDELRQLRDWMYPGIPDTVLDQYL